MTTKGVAMGWSDRQVAMLAEMGLRVWQVPAAAGEPAPAVEAVPPDGAAPARPGPAQDAPGVAPAAVEARRPSPSRTPAPASPPAPSTRPSAEAPVRLRPSGVDTMDWPALRETVAGCTACPLCTGRRQTVFGVGNERAHWMIVGEAPGEQEDREGEPFVGKSGQLLDNMLRAVGLSRAEGEASRQVYIANTVKCRPPSNRNPEPAELAQCEPYLVRQIELVQPRIILAMGRFAVQSLLRSTEPIGRLRGRPHTYQGVPLIVTYHPAYLLRNPEDKARAWDDLCLAREVLSQAPS
jgi:uracil-DNA glycosylase family 4